MSDYENWPTPVIVYQNMLNSSGLILAESIVGNAIHAEEHYKIAKNMRLVHDMQSGKVAMDAAKLKQAKQAVDYGDALFSKTLPKDVLLRENCKPRIAILEAGKILHYEATVIGQMNARLQDDVCI